jgi:hypothetical protein
MIDAKDLNRPDDEKLDPAGEQAPAAGHPAAQLELTLMSIFAAVTDTLFGDPNMALGAVYTPDGSAARLVRVVARRTDGATGFDEARLWSETTRVDLRVAEVANPRPGDRMEIDGEVFLIQGEPVRDRERLVWTVDLLPA